MFLIRFRNKISFLAPHLQRFCSGGTTNTSTSTVSRLPTNEDFLEKYYAKDNVELYMKLFGKPITYTISQARLFIPTFRLEISNRTKARSLLQNHLHLLDLDQRDVIRSFVYLRQQLGFGVDEILARPRILAQNVITLHNHSEVLSECGFSKINLVTLLHFQLFMNRRVGLLKNNGYMPDDLNVLERLTEYFEVTLRPAEQQTDAPLKVLRQIVLNTFFRKYFGLTDNELNRLWDNYPRLRHKSYKSTWRTIRLLEEKLAFTHARIKGNGFLLFADPENIEAILRLGKLGGIDIRELLSRRPKILMNTCETLQKIEKHMREFGITDAAVAKCIDIFTLSSKTVYERLLELNRVKEFQVLSHHPRILRLVHFQRKAQARLDYLKQLKVKCMSLHVLSASSDEFEK